MRVSIEFRAALLLAALASCAAAPSLEAVRATGDEVVFAYAENAPAEAAEASRQASLYCANLGRSAHLREATAEGRRRVATFDCRP